MDKTKDGPFEVLPKESDWTRRKMVRLKSLQRNLIGRKRNLFRMTMCLTCMSCQNDLIGQDGIWSYLLETLMISWSDGSVFWKRLSLADLMDLSSGASFDFFLLLVSRFHTAIRD